MNKSKLSHSIWYNHAQSRHLCANFSLQIAIPSCQSMYICTVLLTLSSIMIQFCDVNLWLYVFCVFLSCLYILYTAVYCKPLIVCCLCGFVMFIYIYVIQLCDGYLLCGLCTLDMFICTLYSCVLSTFDFMLSVCFVRLICTLYSCVLSTFDCILSVCFVRLVCTPYSYVLLTCDSILSECFCQVDMYSMPAVCC